MGLSTSTNSPWCLDYDKGGIDPEKCISWSIRGPKSHFFHLFLLDEGEFQESIFYPKSFGTKNEFYICETMMFIRSIDSSWCDDHDRGEIHPEKCIWWSLRGPKSQTLSLYSYSMKENFESQSVAQNRLEPENEFNICPNMVFITSIDFSWGVDYDRDGIHPEKCIWWSSRGPKSQALPFILTPWGRISRVNLWRKIVWNPRTNLIFFPTWCLSRQSIALDV